MPLELDMFGDDEPEDNGLPNWEGFLPDDATDDDIAWLNEAEELIGKNLSRLIQTPEELESMGLLHDLRGMRFGSGYEAIRWLVTVGLFRWTSLVPLSDGSWGIAIHSTNPEEQDTTNDMEEGNDDGLIF